MKYGTGQNRIKGLGGPRQIIIVRPPFRGLGGGDIEYLPVGKGVSGALPQIILAI